MPFFCVKNGFASHFKYNNAVTGYFHPYDIDVDQERFMHPEINGNIVYNMLMYYNRNRVFPRLHKIMNRFNAHIITYKQYVSLLNDVK